MAITLDGSSGISIGSGNITFPNATTSTIGGFGDGQTWTDMTSSRALNTTYTNSTGKTIFVIPRASIGAAAQGNFTGLVNGSTVFFLTMNSAGAWTMPLIMMVPNGATYNFNATGTGATYVACWELR